MKTNETISKLSQPFWDFIKEHNKAANPIWSNELYQYIILGLQPGAFFTCLYSNDLHGAVSSSHPSNSWTHIMSLVKYLTYYVPPVCYGSKEKVEEWIALTQEARFSILSKGKLMDTEEEYTIKILSEKY